MTINDLWVPCLPYHIDQINNFSVQIITLNSWLINFKALHAVGNAS